MNAKRIRLLIEIIHSPGCRASELAAALTWDDVTIISTLNYLYRQKYVEKQQGNESGYRCVRYRPTDKATEFITSLLSVPDVGDRYTRDIALNPISLVLMMTLSLHKAAPLSTLVSLLQYDQATVKQHLSLLMIYNLVEKNGVSFNEDKTLYSLTHRGDSAAVQLMQGLRKNDSSHQNMGKKMIKEVGDKVHD